MYITLSILAVTAMLFATGRIRPDIVALCSLIVLMLTGVLTPEEALSGFSSTVVIMMAGLFVVGGAVLQTGLAKIVSSRMMKLANGSETRLFFMVMIVTAAIGAFVSNTGTVALMLPIIVSMAAEARLNASRLLMPLAFASSLGTGRKPLPHALRRNPRGKHVLRVALLDPSQRPRNAGGPLLVHGLRQGGAAPSDSHRGCDDARPAPALPVLKRVLRL